MKRLLILLIILALGMIAGAEDFVVTESEFVVISGNISDTLGRTRLTPDSIRIVVSDSAGTELFDAWFEAADAQAALNGDVITFFDQWEDINGAGSVGLFHIMATIASDADNDIDLFSNYNYTLRGVTVSPETALNNIAAILIDVTGINGWTPILDNDSLIIDHSTLSGRPAIGDTSQGVAAAAGDAMTLTAAERGSIADSASFATWEEILTGATHNVATSAGRRLRELSAGQAISSGTAQAGGAAFIRLDDAETVADNIYAGLQVVLVSGTGQGQVRHIESYKQAGDTAFLHLGNEWATNPDATTVYEIIPSAGVDVIHLTDSAKVDIWGSSTVRELTLFDEDNTTIDIDGTTIGTATNLTTNNDKTGYTLTDAEKGLIADSTYIVFINSVYDGPFGIGIWIDDAAGNANTVVGTDGVRSNPVSTIAAATTIASSIGVELFYLINNTNLTLAQSYEGWQFIGIGAQNAIAFGGQDVDGSYFEELMLSGVQGGTNQIILHQCYLSGTDSLNVFAIDCWLADTNSVREATNIVFNQCFSMVPGNDTPVLDFNSAAGAIDISFRHYSGGLEVLNMTSNHTMSYESDGQLIIDATCNSANITARGMMSITNDGTTTALTIDAVFSRAEAPIWIWGTDDTTEVDGSDLGVWLVQNLSGAAGGLDTLSTVFVDRLTGRVADTNWLSLLVDRDGEAGSFGDSAQGWGATGAAGAGANAVYLRFIDTSGTDDTITGVSAVCQNESGVAITGALISQSNGLAGNFNLPSDSVLFVGFSGAAYAWPLAGATIASNDTIDVEGYNVAIPAPGNASFAAVHNREEDFSGSGMEGGIVTIKPAAGVTGPWSDTANGLTFSDIYRADTADASGDWSITFLRSDNLADTTQGWFKVEFRFNNKRIWSYDSLYVPSSGNVNMTDKLAE